MVFDFIDGSAGREKGARRNEARFDDILLQPVAMADVGTRSMATKLMGVEYGLPFGIAPMGLCNLAYPGADGILARAAKARNIPVCLSSAGSSGVEDMHSWSDGLAWFQLYFGQSVDATLGVADRARAAGCDTLVLTVDVPVVSRRERDQRNGFKLPFRMTVRAALDFATHPRWSASTLLHGIPRPRNIPAGKGGFDRKASRAGADWAFLRTLRDHWSGKLVVKGVTSPSDAARAKDFGVDAVYVSNHGGRQLDSAPPAIDLLPAIREAVGSGYPLVFDSGVRNGEDVVKALALGADFVMLGRPVLFALAAAGGAGLGMLLDNLAEDVDVAMAQIGRSRVEDVDAGVLSGVPLNRRAPKARSGP